MSPEPHDAPSGDTYGDITDRLLDRYKKAVEEELFVARPLIAFIARTPKYTPLPPVYGPPVPQCPARWGAYDADFFCQLIVGHDGLHFDDSWDVRMWWES